MITEIVTFEINKEMERERVVALFEESAKIWRAHPKLHRKNYLYDPEAGIAGGVYTWDSVADAQEAHGEAFRARVAETFGSTPRFQYFETPVVVQNDFAHD
ncbi:MAG: monooxygenase [Sulfitobacter sp.]|nr:monooxygenase [Sulfitobacter sp.]